MRTHPLLRTAFLSSLVVIGIATIGLPPVGGAGRPRDDKNAGAASPHHRSPRFTVLLQLEEAGISGMFTGVSGLSTENDVVEFRDGADPNLVHKIPGRTKYGDIVLTRAVTNDPSLWQWRRLVEMGNIADARSNGKIVLLDRGGPVATWTFVNAWPAKLSGPELGGEGNDVALETLTIAHEGVQRN